MTDASLTQPCSENKSNSFTVLRWEGPNDIKTLHLGHISVMFLDTDAVTQPKTQMQKHTTMVAQSVYKSVIFAMFSL